MYRFYRYRLAAPWALVLKAGTVPAPIQLNDWEFTLERGAADTNADVCHEVDQHGYCLIQSGCSFEDLAHEQSVASSVPRASVLADPPVLRETGAAFDFYVHRSLRCWRMALEASKPAPVLVCMDDWRLSRSRSADNTSPAVRREIAERGYSLFKIGGTYAQLPR
jgi:hypothetical protein